MVVQCRGKAEALGGLQTSEAASKDNESSPSGILPIFVHSALVHCVGACGAVLVLICLVFACCTGVVLVDLKTMHPAVPPPIV